MAQIDPGNQLRSLASREIGIPLAGRSFAWLQHARNLVPRRVGLQIINDPGIHKWGIGRLYFKLWCELSTMKSV
jgi:hypothetical protein